MAYNLSEPASASLPADSQPIIKQNFNDLDTIFDVDHVKFSALAGNGEHDKVTFNNVLGADPATLAPKGFAYTKADAVTTFSELFFKNSNGAVRQLTGVGIQSGAIAGGTQYTWLSPWGIRFTMGATNAFLGAKAVAFIQNFTTAVYTGVATADDANPQPISCQSSTAGLTLHTSKSVVVRYLVIGV